MTITEYLELTRALIAENCPGRYGVRVVIDLDDGEKLKLPLPHPSVNFAPDEPRRGGSLADVREAVTELLELKQKRFTGEEMATELQREYPSLKFSAETLPKLLRKMVKEKVIDNRKDSKGNGYGMLDWS